jgi:hypothetical protein
MSRIGRYWLFFVIVAVGLALSWGQIGRKTRHALDAAPVSYLTVESNCLADLRPCAAIAGDHALVLGPVDRGLMLKQTGFDQASVVALEAAIVVDSADDEGVLAVQRADDGWFIPIKHNAGGRLQVRLTANGRTSVADFPLQAE